MGYDSIVLASASTRRSQLLHQIGVRHRVVAADIDENPVPASAMRTSGWRGTRRRRSSPVARPAGSTVLAADTTLSRAAGSWQSLRTKRPASPCSARLPAARTRSHGDCLWNAGQLRLVSAQIRHIPAIDAVNAGAIGRAGSRRARRAPMRSRAWAPFRLAARGQLFRGDGPAALRNGGAARCRGRQALERHESPEQAVCRLSKP